MSSSPSSKNDRPLKRSSTTQDAARTIALGWNDWLFCWPKLSEPFIWADKCSGVQLLYLYIGRVNRGYAVCSCCLLLLGDLVTRRVADDLVQALYYDYVGCSLKFRAETLVKSGSVKFASSMTLSQ